MRALAAQPFEKMSPNTEEEEERKQTMNERTRARPRNDKMAMTKFDNSTTEEAKKWPFPEGIDKIAKTTATGIPLFPSHQIAPHSKMDTVRVTCITASKKNAEKNRKITTQGKKYPAS